MDEFDLLDSASAEGASAFPLPTPSLSSSLQGKSETDDTDMDTTTEEGDGSKKRKKTRNHSGPKKKKLNLHNCTIRTLPVSARTPVRILMEIGQQQKFDVDYKITEQERKPEDNHTGAEKNNSEDLGNGIKEEVKVEEAGDEVSKENGTEPKEKKEFSFWKRKDHFSCTASIRGELFTGSGYSKQVAKNAAAEEAIKALVVREKAPDLVPWSSLACLGLYKVFTEWESQGASLEHLLSNTKPLQTRPEEKPSAIPTIITMPEMPVEKKEKKPPRNERKKEGPKVAGKMPPDPTSRHPVQLLNELHPGLDFVFLVGGENNYDCKVNVETMDFVCKGRKNKKEAKKGAAMEALRVLYNVTYGPTSQFG